MCRALGEETGLPVPATAAFDHPTLAQLLSFVETLSRQSNGTAESATEKVMADVYELPSSHRGGDGFFPTRSKSVISVVAGTVGMGDRSKNGYSLQQSLALGKALQADCPRPVPLSHWDTDGRTGHPRFAACMEGTQEFDPGAFGISLLEGELMDPQQRLMLVAAADLLLLDAPGRNGSVFVGATHPDHLLYGAVAGVVPGSFSATGGSLSVIPGRC